MKLNSGETVGEGLSEEVDWFFSFVWGQTSFPVHVILSIVL